MNLEDIRPSFSIYVVSPRLDSLSGVTETLGLAGYLVSGFEDIDQAFGEVATNPPHVVMLEDDGEVAAIEEIVARIHMHLPETHVIVVAPLKERGRWSSLFEAGVYDIIYLPIASVTEVQRAVDRAVERDFFMYQNERLIASPPTPAEVTPSPAPAPSSVPPLTDAATAPGAPKSQAFATGLFILKTTDECVQAFLDAAGGPAVYFRYLANRRTLVAGLSSGIDAATIEGIGLNFNDEAGDFRTSWLAAPAEIPAFRKMVEAVFRTSVFSTRVLELSGEVIGVFVFPSGANVDPSLDERLLLLDRAIGLIEARRRLHVVNPRDEATEVLARPNFIERVVAEVSRARRVNLPVALLVMAYDQYDLVGQDLGTSEAQLMLKTIAKLCDKYSRVNDVLGRLGAGELGLLLPHTSRRGALIKAERLRRALGQADFARVVRKHPRVTVSIGVSEYPTLVRDADELVASADETLFHIRKLGNRTAVAEPPTNFTPDFAVKDVP